MISNEIIDAILKTCSNMGVFLVNVNIEGVTPEFVINVNKNELVLSLEETLNSTYDIFWSLIYGKRTEKNKNNKITLRYKEVDSWES